MEKMNYKLSLVNEESHDLELDKNLKFDKAVFCKIELDFGKKLIQVDKYSITDMDKLFQLVNGDLKDFSCYLFNCACGIPECGHFDDPVRFHVENNIVKMTIPLISEHDNLGYAIFGEDHVSSHKELVFEFDKDEFFLSIKKLAKEVLNLSKNYGNEYFCIHTQDGFYSFHCVERLIATNILNKYKNLID